jgi:hypothetical protein
MAQNVYLSALEDLWTLVQAEAGAVVECELKGTFQRLLDPHDESVERPFALSDTVSEKRRKLRAAILEILPDCSTEAKNIMETMFEESDAPLHVAATDVLTFLRVWTAEDSSDSDSSDSD